MKPAKHHYMLARPGVEQMKEHIDELAATYYEQTKAQPPVPQIAMTMIQRKQDATYWLGLISYDEKEYTTAEEYFDRMTLKVFPKGPWTDGARYNLARTYEASGKTAEAIKIYESDESPQRFGNQLRARRRKAPAEKTADKQ